MHRQPLPSMIRLLGLGTAMVAAIQFSSVVRAEPIDGSQKVRMPSGESTGVTPEQALHALSPGTEKSSEKELEANDEISRGPAAVVYPQVAPAVVVVHVGNGHGTGFLISTRPPSEEGARKSADGWILTNHHVVADSGITPEGHQAVMIFLGQLDDGFMSVTETGIRGQVYKVDANRDLALLKLDALPDGVSELPAVPLAAVPSLAGSDCVAIGHPRSGMLWTVRSGQIAAVGAFPRDLNQVALSRLASSQEQRDQLTKSLASAYQRKVLMSTCGINPGDSGGPLVNEDGELIAVTFGIPRGGTSEGISLDKFSYHVHLAEVREFLKDIPESPPLYIPSPWPKATTGVLADDDKDGKIDTWYFALGKDQPASGYLVDVDQDTDPKFPETSANDPNKRSEFDFEFAKQNIPLARTFYDVDNDGALDLILTDGDRDGEADLVLVRRDAVWQRVDQSNLKMTAPKYFRDPQNQKRFVELMNPPQADQEDQPAEHSPEQPPQSQDPSPDAPA